MTVRIKFILPRDEKDIEEVKFEHSAQAIPRVGEIVWFTEEAHLPAWRVEWVRHVFGRRGGHLAEIKLERIEPGRWKA
jgi:hypothetical protein